MRIFNNNQCTKSDGVTQKHQSKKKMQLLLLNFQIDSYCVIFLTSFTLIYLNESPHATK